MTGPHGKALVNMIKKFTRCGENLQTSYDKTLLQAEYLWLIFHNDNGLLQLYLLTFSILSETAYGDKLPIPASPRRLR